VINSFLGKRAVVDVLLDNEKSDYFFSPASRAVMRLFGPPAVALFGYPLETDTRLRARDVFRLLSSVPTGSVLDVGCSFGGAYTFEIAKRVFPHRVVGLDIDPLSIGLANRLKATLGFRNVDFEVGNIAEAIDIGGPFDIAITVETLEHLLDDRGAIRNIGRMLKPHGILLVSVPYSSSPAQYKEPQEAFDNQHRLSEAEFSGLFTGGFHWRSGYSGSSLRDVVASEGFETLSLVYTKDIAGLPNCPYLFPVTYPLSRALGTVIGVRRKVTILARKSPPPRWRDEWDKEDLMNVDGQQGKGHR
jgi:SAM-dependent methyltransferase